MSSMRLDSAIMNAKLPAYDRERPDKNRIPMPNDKLDFEWARLA